MFATQHTLERLSAGLALAAFVAVVAIPSAGARTFITDTLGGNGHAKAQSSGIRLITDTLGGNGHAKVQSTAKAPDALQRYYASIHGATPAQVAGGPGRNERAYVNAGMTAAVAASNDRAPFEAPSVSAPSTGGSGFDWSLTGIGAGIAAGLALLLLLGGTRRRTHKRVLAA
jgi:hypothetical protein